MEFVSSPGVTLTCYTVPLSCRYVRTCSSLVEIIANHGSTRARGNLTNNRIYLEYVYGCSLVTEINLLAQGHILHFTFVDRSPRD
jgi:hypothetical protein